MHSIQNLVKEKHRTYIETHAPDLLRIPIFHISSRTIYEFFNFINNRAAGDNPMEQGNLQRLINFEERQFVEEMIRLTNARTNVTNF